MGAKKSIRPEKAEKPGATVSPRPNARSLHCVDQEAAEAAALHDVQGMNGGAPWRAHVVLQLAWVLLRVQHHLRCSLKRDKNTTKNLTRARGRWVVCKGHCVVYLYVAMDTKKHCRPRYNECGAHMHCSVETIINKCCVMYKVILCERFSFVQLAGSQ